MYFKSSVCPSSGTQGDLGEGRGTGGEGEGAGKESEGKDALGTYSANTSSEDSRLGKYSPIITSTSVTNC
jgi:hypothetical protein